MQLGGAEERREMVQRRFPCAGGELFELAVSAAVVSAVVIMARFVWMYPDVSSALSVSRDQAQGSVAALATLAFTGVRRVILRRTSVRDYRRRSTPLFASLPG